MTTRSVQWLHPNEFEKFKDDLFVYFDSVAPGWRDEYEAHAQARNYQNQLFNQQVRANNDYINAMLNVDRLGRALRIVAQSTEHTTYENQYTKDRYKVQR